MATGRKRSPEANCGREPEKGTLTAAAATVDTETMDNSKPYQQRPCGRLQQELPAE